MQHDLIRSFRDLKWPWSKVKFWRWPRQIISYRHASIRFDETNTIEPMICHYLQCDKSSLQRNNLPEKNGIFLCWSLEPIDFWSEAKFDCNTAIGKLISQPLIIYSFKLSFPRKWRLTNTMFAFLETCTNLPVVVGCWWLEVGDPWWPQYWPHRKMTK